MKKPFKRIYLIAPPSTGTIKGMYLGLINIKNYLDQKQCGVCVEIVDLSSPKEAFIKKFINDLSEDDLVGLSVNTATYYSALELVKRIKAKKKCKIIFGGPHAQVQAETILHYNDVIDYVALADGENTLLSLIQAESLLNVPSIAYRKNGRVYKNAIIQLTENELSEIRFEFDEGWFENTKGKLAKDKKSTIPYISSRGCNKCCPFCAIREKKIRTKSIEKIISDLKYLVKEKGYTRIDFEDNFFASDYEKIIELCNKIATEGVVFEWSCQTRVDLADRPEIVALMSDAGCREIFLGTENLSVSGIPNIKDISYFDEKEKKRKIMTPQAYIKKTKNIIKNSYKNNIKPVIMFQMGIPGEDASIREENIKELTNIASIAKKHNQILETYVMVTVIYPGTPLFHTLSRHYGLPKNLFDFWTEWEYKNRNLFIAQNCPHGVGGIPLQIINFDRLKNGDIEWSQHKFDEIKSYYKQIRSIRNINVPKLGEFVVK